MYKIEQIPSVSNFDSRNGVTPFVIVDHISGGTIGGMTSWFQDTESQVSSNYGISRAGDIVQYVRIEDRAWCQGIPLPLNPELNLAPVVRAMDMNPNYFCISIEHEGTDGNLTEAQFQASCWLHRFIKEEVKRIYNTELPLGNYNVIGHFMIDPVRKPFCPGPKFPWSRLFAELAIADNMTMQDYEGRLTYLGSDSNKAAQAFSIGNEVTYLYTLSKGTDGTAMWAKQILLGLHPVMTTLGLLTKPYSEETSSFDVYNQALYLYTTGQQKDGTGAWAKQQLLTLYPYMLQNGLIAT